MNAFIPSRDHFLSTVEHLKSVNGNVPLMKEAAEILLQQEVPIIDMIIVDWVSILKMFQGAELGVYFARLSNKFYEAAADLFEQRPEIQEVVEELHLESQNMNQAAVTLAALSSSTSRRSQRAKNAPKTYSPEKVTVARRGSKALKRFPSVTGATVTVPKRTKSLIVPTVIQGTVSEDTAHPEVRRGVRARTLSRRYSHKSYST